MNGASGMIEARDLTKKFGETVAVDRLNLQVDLGEVFGFLGPNGAGKTTTIRMLAALIKPTHGSARVAGFALGERDRLVRKNVGVLTESPGLYDALSAERNLAFFAELYEVHDVPTQVERYLRLLGLWERRQEAVGTFSKGMRQKLAIARALLHEPQVLFLDEPTSGLDPEMARMVRTFIEELKQEGRTIFLSTHNLHEADRLCDRIAIINTHLLAVDTPANMRRRLYGRQVVFHLRQEADAYLGVLQGLAGVDRIQALDNKLLVGVEDPEEHNPELVRALVEAGAQVQFVGELRHTLEDVYLRLMGQQQTDCT